MSQCEMCAVTDPGTGEVTTKESLGVFVVRAFGRKLVNG